MGYTKVAPSFGTPWKGIFTIEFITMLYFVSGNTLFSLKIKINSMKFCIGCGFVLISFLKRTTNFSHAQTFLYHIYAIPMNLQKRD